MTELLNITTTVRKLIYPVFEQFSLEQLNKIPAGFSNNIFWNAAHIVASQQILVYKLSGLPMLVSDEMVAKYRKDTKPEAPATQEEVDEIKHLFFATLAQTQKDSDAGVFVNFNEYPTSSGYVIKTTADAIKYNLMHEGLHLGVIMSLKKLV